ncbi:MAG: hypothetical protein K2P09_03715 [Erysipelotrichales bacterium]|nr:hypothetical protein [Erysipelotrichales bacterium]
MKKKIELELQKGNHIVLPQNIVEALLLKEGDKIQIEYDPRTQNKCFHIQEDNEEELFNEGFYCIPERVFINSGIPLERIQLIVDKESITITTSDQIINSLGNELIESLIEQDVDFDMLANDLVDCINEGIRDESNL